MSGADEKPRDLVAYADAVHHLAWLACEDHEDIEPDTDVAYESLALAARTCDLTAPTEDGSHYIRPALDLLWLAYADCEGTPQAKRIEKAIELLEKVLHG